MRAFAFFALFALTASAFNLTDYHLGIASGLNFNLTESQEGQTCLNALVSDFQAIAGLIEGRNFDNITLGLGDLVIQVQDDLETTCKPYFVDYYTLMASYINVSNLTEIIKENIEQNYPQLISEIGQWYQSISEGQDYSAGYIQAQFFEILVGIQQETPSVSPQVTAVPFNATAFFTEYNAALFQMLGIDAQINITGLVECNDYVQNATFTFIYMKEKLSTMDFEQKLDALQYLIGLTLDSVRNCDAAYDVMELVYGPVEQAFSEDPVNFTIQALDNLAMAFPSVMQTFKSEVVDIETGDYSDAGQAEGARLFDIFQNLVPWN